MPCVSGFIGFHLVSNKRTLFSIRKPPILDAYTACGKRAVSGRLLCASWFTSRYWRASPWRPWQQRLDVALAQGMRNPPLSPDGRRELRIETFKDAEGRVKRQAARFQVWAYEDESPQGRPLKLGDPVEGGGRRASG